MLKVLGNKQIAWQAEVAAQSAEALAQGGDRDQLMAGEPALAGVLFDLDGTLLDTLEDLADSTNRCLARLGLPPHPPEAYRYFVGDGLGNLARRVLPAERRDPATIEDLKELFNRDYSGHWADKTRPYDGIAGLLDDLSRPRPAHGHPVQQTPRLHRGNGEALPRRLEVFRRVRGPRLPSPQAGPGRGPGDQRGNAACPPRGCCTRGTPAPTCRPPATRGCSPWGCCGASGPAPSWRKAGPGSWFPVRRSCWPTSEPGGFFLVIHY